MSNYYANHENALNEARNVISQRNTDDLNKLINNEEDMTRMIANLHEVKSLVVKECFAIDCLDSTNGNS